MNHPSPRPASSRASLRKVGVALSVTLVCNLFSATSQAQWIVSDPGTELQTTLTAVQSAISAVQSKLVAANTLETQLNTYEQLQNILMKAQSLGSDISLVSTPLKEITNSGPIIDSACPGGSGGGIIGDAIGAISSALDANAPVTARQRQLCSMITVYKIDEYNKTVDALNDVGNYSATTIGKLNDLVASVKTLGTTTNAQAQAEKITAGLTARVTLWQTQVTSDKSLISALQEQQGILAKIALKGSPTPLGTLVQAAALKAAFTINQ